MTSHQPTSPQPTEGGEDVHVKEGNQPKPSKTGEAQMRTGDARREEGGVKGVIQFKLSATGEEVREQPQPQAGEDEVVLMEDGDQSQPEGGDGGPVHGKRGIQSKLSVTGEEVRDRPNHRLVIRRMYSWRMVTSLNQPRLVGEYMWMWTGMMRMILRMIQYSMWG